MVRFSPDYARDQTVFLGTKEEGPFKSTNGGNFWRPVDEGLTSLKTVGLVPFAKLPTRWSSLHGDAQRKCLRVNRPGRNV